MVHKITPNNREIRRVLINENRGGARLVNRYVSQSPLDRRAEDLGFIVPNLAALGIFLIIVNAGLLYLASWLAGQIGRVDFKVDSFGAAILGSIVIGLVSFVAGIFIHPRNIARSIA